MTQSEPGVYEWANRTGRRWRVTRGRTVRLPDKAATAGKPGRPRPNERIDVIHSHAVTL